VQNRNQRPDGNQQTEGGGKKIRGKSTKKNEDGGRKGWVDLNQKNTEPGVDI